MSGKYFSNEQWNTASRRVYKQVSSVSKPHSFSALPLSIQKSCLFIFNVWTVLEFVSRSQFSAVFVFTFMPYLAPVRKLLSEIALRLCVFKSPLSGFGMCPFAQFCKCPWAGLRKGLESLACCSSRGRKEADATEQWNSNSGLSRTLSSFLPSPLWHEPFDHILLSHCFQLKNSNYFSLFSYKNYTFLIISDLSFWTFPSSV